MSNHETNSDKHLPENNFEKLDKKIGFAATSLTLGILGLFLGCLTLGIPLSILGLIFGSIALVKKQGGLALGGTIVSFIGVIFSLFFIFFFNGDPYYFINPNPASIISPITSEEKVVGPYTLGETVAIENSGAIEYLITINSVTPNLKDNTQEIVISYTYENLTLNKDLIINSTDFRVLDEDNTVAKNTTPDPTASEGAPKGANVVTTMTFTLSKPSDNITIILEDSLGETLSIWKIPLQ